MNENNRKLVEEALGRPLNDEEESGYPNLAALPEHVINSVKVISERQNRVVVSVYLRHVVPSASIIDVKGFLDRLSL